MKKTLVAFTIMVLGLSFTASARPPLDFDPTGEYTILYVDDPEAFDPDDLDNPYWQNDGYWGTLMDFLTGLDTDEVMFDCLEPECDTTTGKFKDCDDRQTVFDGVDMDGVLLRKAAARSLLPPEDEDYTDEYADWLDYESIPDKAEMMLLATALDNNPGWVTVLDGGEDIFLDFTDIMTDLTDWGILPANKTAMLGAFEVFCQKYALVKPVISGVITYSATPSVTVTITCATEGAVIHYTTDGSSVSLSKPTYTVPVVVNGAVDQTITIKAKAYKAGVVASASADTKSYLLLATAPITPELECGTWAWAEDMKKVADADADAKAFDGFVIDPDPAFYVAATTEPGLSTVTLPTARVLAGAQVIAGFVPQLIAALPGIGTPLATTVATHMVMGTKTALQIATDHLGPWGGAALAPTIQGYINTANTTYLVPAFVSTYATLGGLIGTLAEDLTETLDEDVEPITIALPLHAKAFTALEALGDEMNMAWTLMLASLLEDLFAQIEETEDLPGAPEGGYTIPELCELLGSTDAMLGLKAGGGINNVCLGLGLTGGPAACAAAATVFEAGAVAMNAVVVPTMPILGGAKADPPLSPGGDYDGDGITNLEAYNLVMDAHGDYQQFVAAAGGGFWTKGNPEAPAVGLLGLAALVSVIAAGGAFVLRKK